MLLLLAATVFLCIMKYHTLRGGLIAPRNLTIVGMDREGVGLGVLAFAAAALYFGPLYGVAIVISVMIHEFGHVAAFRICGHTDARFRLIPLAGGVAISDKLPDTELKSFFIALMGPAICIAPMVVAFVAAELFSASLPLISEGLLIFALVTAWLNFINLLPFWPLDGGRCMKIISDTFLPGATPYLLLTMSAGLAAAAVAMQSLILTLFALMGAQSLFTWSEEFATRSALSKRQGRLALAAYLFTLGTHFWGGVVLMLHL